MNGMKSNIFICMMIQFWTNVLLTDAFHFRLYWLHCPALKKDWALSSEFENRIKMKQNGIFRMFKLAKNFVVNTYTCRAPAGFWTFSMRNEHFFNENHLLIEFAILFDPKYWVFKSFWARILKTHSFWLE